jgi:hypothetical protein
VKLVGVEWSEMLTPGGIVHTREVNFPARTVSAHVHLYGVVDSGFAVAGIKGFRRTRPGLPGFPDEVVEFDGWRP